MGALHRGHLALVEKSMQIGDATVVSIFVNPTQFNQAADLAAYPRQPEQDILALSSIGESIVFMPSVEEVYPSGSSFDLPLDLGHLGKVMEGKFRPGHFEGVAQVVKRLLDLVQPDFLVMGQKDLQQIRVVEHLLRTFKLSVELIPFPTVREPNGLAMSSRNQRLSESDRQKAGFIYRVLKTAHDRYLQGLSSSKVAEGGRKELSGAGFEVEYFDLVDAKTLLEMDKNNTPVEVAICTAVWLSGIRLIDNILVKP